MANASSAGRPRGRYANITTDFLEFYRDSTSSIDAKVPNHRALVHNKTAKETEEQPNYSISADPQEMNHKLIRADSPNIMVTTPSRDHASLPSSASRYSPTLHRASKAASYTRPSSYISSAHRDLNDEFYPFDRQGSDERFESSPSRLASIRRAGAVSVTPARRYSPLPEKKRHSLTFGALDSSFVGATALTRDSATRSSSTSHRSKCIERRRRSEVWEEIEAIKERISKLKGDSPLNATVDVSLGKNSSSQSESELQSSSEQFEHLADELDATEDDDRDKTIMNHEIGSFEDNTVLERKLSSRAKQDHRSTPLGDWEQKEPVTAIMSSPTSTRTASSHSYEALPRQQGNASPVLTRHTPAEKHLLEAFERARRLHDRNVSMVMLERVVSDTITLYSNVEGGHTDFIDRVCLSLADFITHTTETAVQSSAYTPSQVPQGRNSVIPYGSSVSRHWISPITRSSTNPSVSAYYDPISPSLSRSSSFRHELDVNSPKFRSPSNLSGQRLRHSRPLEISDKKNYF